jgi:hypothetical protein
MPRNAGADSDSTGGIPHRVESDKRYYEALKNGDFELWCNTTLAEVEDRGHHEVLNWFCLVGAIHELGRKKPDESVFLESWITNSDKVFAVFRDAR